MRVISAVSKTVGANYGLEFDSSALRSARLAPRIAFRRRLRSSRALLASVSVLLLSASASIPLKDNTMDMLDRFLIFGSGDTSYSIEPRPFTKDVVVDALERTGARVVRRILELAE